MLTRNWIQGAFRHSPIGTAIVDLYGNWIGVNPALTRILGYSEAELLKQNFDTITHPDDVEADYSAMRRLTSREIDFFETEKRFRVKTGSYVWVLLTAALVFNDVGEPQYYISQIQDISAQVALRAQANKTLGDLSSLVNDANVIIMRYSRDFRYLFINDAVERELGLSPSKMIGFRIEDVNLPDAFMKLVKSALEVVIESGQPLEKTFERPSLHGHKHVVARFQPEFGPEGDVESVIVVSTDITGIKAVELQLRNALAEIRQLQSILPICSYCKSIRDDNDYWSSVESYVSKHTDSRFSHSICPDCYQREVVPQLEELAAEHAQ